MFSKKFILCVLLLLPVAFGFAAEHEGTVKSQKGRFTVSYKSELEPIEINQIHSWTLHLEDSAGQPVENADISVMGGMPEHNHGLATAPGITSKGGGDYLLQGLRFHMMGYWELELDISYQGISDKVVITLNL